MDLASVTPTSDDFGGQLVEELVKCWVSPTWLHDCKLVFGCLPDVNARTVAIVLMTLPSVLGLETAPS